MTTACFVINVILFALSLSLSLSLSLIFFYLPLPRHRTLEANNELQAELGALYEENKHLHSALDNPQAKGSRPPTVVEGLGRPRDTQRSLAEHERTLRDLLHEISVMKDDLRSSTSDRDRYGVPATKKKKKKKKKKNKKKK